MSKTFQKLTLKSAGANWLKGFTTTSEEYDESLLSSSSSAVEGNAQKAFTLIELLVVIAIISLLSSVVLASLSSARERAKIARMVSDFKQIETGMTMWMQSTGQTQWPHEDSFSFTNDLVSNGYLTTMPEPPLGGNRYIYENDGQTFSCSGTTNQQIAAYVGNIPASIANEVNKIVDGDANLSCGKIRQDTNANLLYSLSTDGSL